VRPEADQLAHREGEQNQPPCDLEVGHGDSERFENNFAEKNEPNRNQQTGEQAEKRLMFAMFARRLRPKSYENRDQSDRVDRDKHWNKREQKFLDHSPQMNTDKTQIQQNSVCYP